MPRSILLCCIFALNCLSVAAADDEDRVLTLKEAKAVYEKADAALNGIWGEARKALPAEEFTALKEDQKSWLEMRDRLALSPSYSGAPDDPEEAKQSREYLSTAAFLMEDRVRWLKGLLAEEGDSLTGIWEDSRGGHLEVVERDGQIHFILETVRGHTADLGRLAGIASWNAPIGWFSDKGRDKDKTEETSLSFTWRDRVLEIIGANTEHYHGKRAWFDGRYVKVGALDKAQTSRVLKAAKTGEIPEKE